MKKLFFLLLFASLVFAAAPSISLVESSRDSSITGYAVINVSNPTNANIQIPSNLDFTAWFKKQTSNLPVANVSVGEIDWSFFLQTNVSKTQFLLVNSTCYDQIFNNATNVTTNVSSYCWQTQPQTYYGFDWVPFNPAGFTIVKRSSYLVKIVGTRLDPKTNYDWVLSSFGTNYEQWAWWNTSWYYFRPLSITTNVNLSNYSANLFLNTSNVNANWNWVNNGSDLRFTQPATGTEQLIPYWIEYWNSTNQSASVWLNANYTILNGTQINMYYGNSTYGNQSTKTIFTNNLSIFWTFADNGGTTVTDSSGNGNTGTLSKLDATFDTKTSGWTRNAKYGQGIKFNNTNGAKVDSPALTLNGSNCTRAMWIRLNNTVGTQNVYLMDFGTGNKYWMQLYDVDSDGKLETRVGAGSTTYVDGTVEFTSTSQWYWVVATMWNTNLTTYVNGAVSVTGTKTAATASNIMHLGGYGDGTLNFNGTIDQVMIYNRSLSAAEVAARYAAQEPLFTVGSETIQAAALTIANATLNETSVNPNAPVFFNVTIQNTTSLDVAAAIATWRYPNATTKNVTLTRASSTSQTHPFVQNGIFSLPNAASGVVVLSTAVNVSRAFVICNPKTGIVDTQAANEWAVTCELTNSTAVTVTRGTTSSAAGTGISYSVVESPNVLVQRGTASSASGIVDAVFTAVNLSRSIIILSTRTSTGTASRTKSAYATASFRNTTGMRITYSDSASTTDNFAWQVVEFNDGTTVQSGTVAGSMTQKLSAVVTEVNMSNAWLHYNYNTTTSSITATSVGANLTNSTGIDFWAWGDATFTVGIDWFLAEFPAGAGGNVQRDITNITGLGSSAGYGFFSNSVNTSRAFGYLRHAYVNGTGTGWHPGEWRVSFENSTCLLFGRGNTLAYSTLPWQVVELPPLTVATTYPYYSYTFTETDTEGFNNVTFVWANDTAGNANSTTFATVGVNVVAAASLAFTMTYPLTGCVEGQGASGALGICVRCYAVTTDLVGLATETGVACQGQTDATAFFAFTNGGSVAEKWQTSLNTSLGATLAFKFDTDNTYAGSKDVNATTPLTVNASIPIAATEYAWAWADFSSAMGGTTVRGVFSNSSSA